MVLLIIIPFLNGYFIGNIPYFQTNPYDVYIIAVTSSSLVVHRDWYRSHCWIMANTICLMESKRFEKLLDASGIIALSPECLLVFQPPRPAQFRSLDAGRGQWLRAWKLDPKGRWSYKNRETTRIWKMWIKALEAPGSRKSRHHPSTLPQHRPSLPIVPLAAQINHFLNTTAVEIMLSH